MKKNVQFKTSNKYLLLLLLLLLQPTLRSRHTFHVFTCILIYVPISIL